MRLQDATLVNKYQLHFNIPTTSMWKQKLKIQYYSQSLQIKINIWVLLTKKKPQFINLQKERRLYFSESITACKVAILQASNGVFSQDKTGTSKEEVSGWELYAEWVGQTRIFNRSQEEL